MKKTLMLILALCLLVCTALFSACASDKNNNEENKEEVNSQNAWTIYCDYLDKINEAKYIETNIHETATVFYVGNGMEIDMTSSTLSNGNTVDISAKKADKDMESIISSKIDERLNAYVGYVDGTLYVSNSTDNRKVKISMEDMQYLANTQYESYTNQFQNAVELFELKEQLKTAELIEVDEDNSYYEVDCDPTLDYSSSKLLNIPSGMSLKKFIVKIFVDKDSVLQKINICAEFFINNNAKEIIDCDCTYTIPAEMTISKPSETFEDISLEVFTEVNKVKKEKGIAIENSVVNNSFAFDRLKGSTTAFNTNIENLFSSYKFFFLDNGEVSRIKKVDDELVEENGKYSETDTQVFVKVGSNDYTFQKENGELIYKYVTKISGSTLAKDIYFKQAELMGKFSIKTMILYNVTYNIGDTLPGGEKLEKDLVVFILYTNGIINTVSSGESEYAFWEEEDGDMYITNGKTRIVKFNIEGDILSYEDYYGSKYIFEREK